MKARHIAAFLLQATTIMATAQSLTLYRNDGTQQSMNVSSIDSIVYSPSSLYETPRNQTSNLTLDISTDSACYHPGSEVQFKFSSVLPSGARVRYMHLGKVILEHELTGRSWTWQVPAENYKGYMVQVYQANGDTETIRGTVAVDVSTDWKKFPRYGFVATFGSNKTASVVSSEMDWLCRCHINGVQFQDWHYKHHWPWGGNDEGEFASYKDIANRTVYTSSVRNYIDAQHKRGMKSMFYNLCYGALEDAEEDGVAASWFLFKDASRQQRDYHGLPDSWKSDIYLVDPGLLQWIIYMRKRNAEVYEHLDFDGYQIDQLGYRGTLYKSSGATIDMTAAYATFIKAMKSANPDKRLVMNAVGSYGAEKIAKTGKVDFLYNEMWDGESKFSNLYDIIKANDSYGGDSLRTVFAAYMNYNCDNRDFNMPGVLLTDAVMFALGGSHLELGGDHMLCREYFPYSGVTMSQALKKAITRYYDFLTAYENLLRDGGTLDTSAGLVPSDTSGKYSINGWAPSLGGITSIARVMEGRTVVHLLNFISANSLSWRDLNGDMPAPTVVADLPISIRVGRDVSHVYVASPDYNGGAMQELSFVRDGDSLQLTVPGLTYWTMLVFE